MSRLTVVYGFLLIALSALLLTGCEISRPAGQAADIDQFNPPVAVAQVSGQLRLEPSSRQLNVGETATFQLRLDNALNLTEVNLELRFTPGIIEIQDSDSGTEGVQIQPGDFFSADYVGNNQVDNGAGIIRYYALPEITNGSGLLANIIFRAVNPGSTSLSFAVAELADEENSLEPVAAQPAEITVNAVAGQPSPVFTPQPVTPTSTPTFIPAGATPTPTLFVVTATPIPTLTPTPLPAPTNTPAAMVAQIPPGATQGFCYRVQPGESLANLGNKCAVDTRFCNLPDPGFISLANDLHPPGYIYPQQVLFIPRAYGSGPNVYVVQAGDTLAGIAEQCQMKVDLLAYVNGLAEDANLEGIGTLIIPRPPFAPPSRYPYPQVGPPSVWPPPCPGSCGY